MKIRRTANAGVLLKLDGVTILMDGVCREVKPYPATPPEVKEELRASMPDAVEQVIAEIKKHPETWWTVEELARQCNWSVSQFRRNFMRHTGMLPKEYIEESKLRHSAELLLSSSLTVREIALRFGYRDPFHFSRRFKHRFGVSPESYRSSGGVNMA